MANPEVEQILGELGHAIEPDRTVWLHRATTQQAAAAIKQSGVMTASEGFAFLATHPAIACRIVDPADGVLTVRARVDDLFVHRRPDELSYDCIRAPTLRDAGVEREVCRSVDQPHTRRPALRPTRAPPGRAGVGRPRTARRTSGRDVGAAFRPERDGRP